MKLMFCEECGDLVTPHRRAGIPRYCECQKACCWWINPTAGQFAVWSAHGKKAVSVVGIHNALLTTEFPNTFNEANQNFVEFGCLQRPTMDHLINETPDSYLFKHLKSLVVRFRPGFSNDTVFVDKVPQV